MIETPMLAVAISGTMMAALFAMLLAGQGIGFLQKYLTGKEASKVSLAQLGLQEKQFTAGEKAAKRAYTGAKEEKQETWKQLGEIMREQKTEGRKERFEAGQQASKDRQVAMLMAAMQMITGAGSRASRPSGMAISDILRR